MILVVGVLSGADVNFLITFLVSLFFSFHAFIYLFALCICLFILFIRSFYLLFLIVFSFIVLGFIYYLHGWICSVVCW